MRKKMIMLTAAAAVMLAVTACGTKDKAKDESSAAVTQEVTASTEAAADGAATEAAAGSTAEEASEEESTENAAAAETAVPPVGSLSADGVYKSDSGRFEITPPAGWTMDDSSDKSYVTYESQTGDSTLEIVDLTGSAIDSEREQYPATAEEYQKMVSRGDGMKILSYEVKNKSDGSQTFQYTAQYDNPDDDVHFRAVSGVYDAGKKTYVCVTGTVMSTDEGAIKTVEDSVKSLKVN